MYRTTHAGVTRAAIALTTLALALTACGGPDAADVSGGLPTAPTSEPVASPSPAEPADFTVEPEGQELALVGASSVEVLYTLPDEGESVFRAAALRPGATRDDMVVVVVTSAEGMYDLRWLEVTGGEVGELRAFPDEHQLPVDLSGSVGDDPAEGMSRQELVPVPVWSPDGRSLGWVLPAEDSDAATLRTVGWSDGPGTGDTADDNASFGLEIGSSQGQAREWTAGEGDRSVLRVETAAGAAYDVHLERQGDGALALLDVTPA